jgi:hypothetical protein
MDVNIPPLVTVLGGLGVVALCFALRIPIFLVGLLSLILLAYTVVLNRNMFEIDYDKMTFVKSIAAVFGTAPVNGLPSILLIATVVILALGYIIYLFGLSSLFTNAVMILPSFSSLSLSRSPQGQALSTPQSQYKNYKNSGFVSAFNRAI